MKVTVCFTIDVDTDAWNAGAGGPIEDYVVESEVRQHAEMVIRDLYFDQGWTKQQ